MGSLLIYTKDEQKKIKDLAEKIFKTYDVKCDKGGCQYHSGHEFCSVDEAWDQAEQEAIERLFEQ